MSSDDRFCHQTAKGFQVHIFHCKMEIDTPSIKYLNEHVKEISFDQKAGDKSECPAREGLKSGKVTIRAARAGTSTRTDRAEILSQSLQ